VSGPIGIADTVTTVFWQAGPVATLYLAGLLSANLALVNLLPFPPLDGGRMLMIAIKRVAGARVSLKAEQATYLVGFAFLFAFLIWITVFDIARLGGAVP
jgi:regulator of sigma E protease